MLQWMSYKFPYNIIRKYRTWNKIAILHNRGVWTSVPSPSTWEGKWQNRQERCLLDLQCRWAQCRWMGPEQVNQGIRRRVREHIEDEVSPDDHRRRYSSYWRVRDHTYRGHNCHAMLRRRMGSMSNRPGKTFLNICSQEHEVLRGPQKQQSESWNLEDLPNHLLLWGLNKAAGGDRNADTQSKQYSKKCRSYPYHTSKWLL